MTTIYAQNGQSIWPVATTPTDLTILKLRQIAAQKGVLFGSAYQSDVRVGKPGPGGVGTLADFLAQECDIYAPGVALLPNLFEPTPGSYSLDAFNSFLAAVATGGKQWRIHALMYPSRDTAAVNAAITSGNWQSMIDARFQAIKDAITAAQVTYPNLPDPCSIDVTNEVLDFNRVKSNGGYETSAWYNVAGPDFIHYSFTKARELWPNAQLCWADALYQMNDTFTQRGIEAWIGTMKTALAAGVPIDSINTHGHLTFYRGHTRGQLIGFLNQVKALGLDVNIGEFDIRTGYKSTGYTGTPQPSEYTIEAYDAFGASLSRQWLADVMPFIKSNRGLKFFICWGMSDIDHSWESSSNPPGERPLPFDASYQPKPLYAALRRAFLEM